jgi:hypothetical protein
MQPYRTFLSKVSRSRVANVTVHELGDAPVDAESNGSPLRREPSPRRHDPHSRDQGIHVVDLIGRLSNPAVDFVQAWVWVVLSPAWRVGGQRAQTDARRFTGKPNPNGMPGALEVRSISEEMEVPVRR